MDLDAILECFGVFLFLLSKSEIYFDLPARITINIVGNYQTAGNIQAEFLRNNKIQF